MQRGLLWNFHRILPCGSGHCWGARFDELYAYATPQPARGVTVNARCAARRNGSRSIRTLTQQPSKFAPRPLRRRRTSARAPRLAPRGRALCTEPSASAPRCAAGRAARYAGGRPLRRPGGKTSQLAAALQGQGLLLANEFVAARAEILRQNLERMGVTNAVITNEDTARLAAAMPGQFDRVLVDAPCSGEGCSARRPSPPPSTTTP